MFIYFEREREKESVGAGGGQRERGRERIPRRLCTVSAELDLSNHETMTQAEIKSWCLNRLSHPDAPIVGKF